VNDGQYVPNQLFDPKSKGNFGGQDFDKKGSARGDGKKVNDDLVFTAKKGKGKDEQTKSGSLNESNEGALDHSRNASVSVPLKEGMEPTVREDK